VGLLRNAGRKLRGVLAVLAAMALIVNAAVTIVNVRRMSAANAWVVHTHEVREALGDVLLALRDTEARRRAFLISGQPRYLGPPGGRDAVERRLARVVELTRDDLARQQQIEAMRPLIAGRLDLLDQAVELKKSGEYAGTRVTQMMDEGSRLWDELQARFDAILATQNELLEERVQSSTRAARTAIWTSLLGLGTSLALLIAAVWALAARARAVLRAKDSLEAVLRALPDAVLLIDSERRVAAMNPTAAELFRRTGRPPPTTVDELAALGTPSPRLEETLRRQQPLAPHLAALPVSRVGLDAAIRVDLAGETRRLLPRTAPLPPVAGRGGSVLVLSDVTDLVRIDEMRSDLVATASH
jgi:CHASE3 domain sensor protein